ncbi:hypothetical protein EV177_000859 [Coemansia sp. RSA 1804]|nr:hypothetical protein EV177_000859 [Coemansia sp. RSA 1804]
MGSDAYSVAMDDGEAFALIGAGADMGADEFPYSPTSGAIYRDQGFSYSASGLLLGAGRPSNTLMATSASSATAVAAAAAAASAAALLVSQGIRMSMPADMGESLSDFHPFSISASLPCVKSGSSGNVGAFGGGLAMGCNNGSGSQMVAASASASGGVVASAAGLPFLQVGQNHYHQPQQQQQQQQHLQLQIRQQDIARSAAAAAAAVATDSTVSGGGAGIFSTFGEGNMLHALLSRLPEPPVSRPNNNSNSNINNDSSSNINYLNSSVASLTALADSLPVPPHTRTDEEDEEEGRGDGRPLSPPPSSPSLSLSSSMDSVDSATPTIDTLRQTTLINGPEPPLLLLDTRAQAKEPLASTAVGQNRKQQQQKQKQQRFSAVMAADQEAGAVAGNAEQTGRAQSRRPSTGLSGLLGKNLASLDVSGMIVAPETPASSRRNTDEVSLTKQHRDQLQTIEPGEPLGRNSSSGSSAGATRAAASPGPTLLDAEMLSSEMPPPFIMEEDNGTAGRAQIEQMSLTGRQRATWCGVSAQTLELTPSGARTRSRTRTSIVDGVPEPEMPLADRPDGSDKQQREQLPAIPAVEESDGHMYRLDIRGLFESPLSKRCGKCRRQRPHAVLRAMDGKSQPDAKEANSVMRGGAGLELRDGQRRLLHVSRAMRRALLLGPTAAADGTMGGNKTPLMDEGKATGMRQPSCHCEAGTTSSGAQDNQDSSSSSRKRWTDLLAVSVVASANPPPLSSADKRAACVDIEAMVALHLPRVFSRFRRIVGDDARCDEGDSQQQQQQPQQPKAPAPSAGSNSGSRLPLASMRLAGRRSDAGIVPATRIPLGAAIAADGSGIRRPWNGMRQRLSTPPSLDIQRSLRMSSGSGIGSSISSAGCDTTTYLHTAQLHAARSSSLRRTTTPSSSALPSPATPRSLVPRPSVSRRRSEVQALISQANAVLGNSNSNSSSNGFGTAPPAASRLRPPRSSLPLSFAENIHARAPNGSSSSRFSGNYYSQSLRYSLATPRTSVLSLSPRNSQRLSSLSESEATTPLRASPPAALSAALSRQHHRLESARGESASPGGDVSPLALTPVRSLNSDVFASVRTARGMRASVRSAAAAGSSASASASALGSTRIPIIRNASASQIHASMPAIRRLPSSGRLRPVGADHDDSISSSSSLPSLARRVTVNQGRRVAAAAAAAAASAAFSSGASDSDSEFLTLRPVHTPDLVPRTIDPRLIERAMTPMLKRNIKAQQQQHLSQQPRSLAHALVGSLVESMESMESGAKPTHALLPSPPPHSPSPPPPPHPQSQSPPQQTLPLSPRLSQSLSPRQSLLARDSTSTTTQDASGGVSRMSPLNSPDISADAPRRRSFGAGRFAMPTGLFSRSKKNSSKPVSAVSAIPMPPPPSSASASASATATASASAKVRSSNLGISNIPSLSKARSLWSLKAGSAIASSLYFSKK